MDKSGVSVNRLNFRSVLVAVFIVLGLQNVGHAQSLSVQEKVSSYKPYWFNGFTLAGYDLKLQEVGGGQVTSYNYLTYNYGLGSGRRFVMRLAYIVNSPGWSQFEDKPPAYNKADMFFDDLIVSYIDNSLVLLPGDIQVYWDGRLYLPVGQQSLLENRIGRIRNDFILSKYITQKVELVLWSKFNYYIQSRTTYVTDIPQNDETGETLEVLTNTKQWGNENWLDLWYRINYDYAVSLRIGNDIDRYYQAPNQGKFKDTAVRYHFGANMRFNVSDSINMIAGVKHEVAKADFSQILKVDKDNIGFALLAFYSF